MNKLTRNLPPLTPPRSSLAPGFVESFAFGGEAPASGGQCGGEAVAVGEPRAPWALPYAVGTSHWDQLAGWTMGWEPPGCRALYMAAGDNNQQGFMGSWVGNHQDVGQAVITNQFSGDNNQ